MSSVTDGRVGVPLRLAAETIRGKVEARYGELGRLCRLEYFDVLIPVS